MKYISLDINKKILFTTLSDERTIHSTNVDKALNLVLNDDRPLKIINAPANISAAIMRSTKF